MDIKEIADRIEASELPVAVVTGASSGMGMHTACQLASDYLVVAVGRNQERLEKTADSHNNILPLQFDFKDLQDIEKVFSQLPRVNALANIAAIAPAQSLEETSLQDWQEILNLNVIASAELTRVVLPQLRVAGSPESPATVVFVGSGASRNAFAGNTIYTASKHALQGLADSFRKEVASENIRVTTVAPGPTDTPLLRTNNPDASAEGLIQPETVARSICHAIAAPADTQLTEIWVRPRVEFS